MKFRSTRGDKDELRAAQAIIRGIAPDRGLYVPEEIPAMPFDLNDMADASYQDVAKKVIGAFFTDYTEEEIADCVDGAYDSKFDTEEIAPLVKAGDAWFIELYHGKTAAFKDMALSILPRLLTKAIPNIWKSLACSIPVVVFPSSPLPTMETLSIRKW